MKKWISLVSLLMLVGCHYIETEPASDEEIFESVDKEFEVTPYFEEVERLLTRIELEAGLDNLATASSLFRELMVLATDRDVTVHQQARINTMAELLADTLAAWEDEIPEEERRFTGSDAAAKVMNMIGFTPDGYQFVYHEIPSFIGSDGLGYYVFLIPVEPTETGELEIRETFFVTDRGEILVLE